MALGQPALGYDGKVQVTVRNRGEGGAVGFQVALSAAGSPLGSQNVLFLGGGQSKALTFTWKPPAAGEAVLRAEADPGNSLGEADTGNNILEQTVQVAPGRPDLQVTGLEALAPDGLMTGVPVDLKVTVQNNGPVSSGPVRTALYECMRMGSSDTVWKNESRLIEWLKAYESGGKVVEQWNGPDIATGGSAEITLQWVPQGGVNYCKPVLVVFATPAVPEADPADNSFRLDPGDVRSSPLEPDLIREVAFRDLNMGSDVTAMAATADGSFVFAGRAGSDIRLFKTDGDGNLLWSQTPGTGIVNVLRETADRGLVLAGYDGVRIGNQSKNRVLLLRTDAGGGLLWQQNFSWGGDEEDDEAFDVRQTLDGGFIISGKRYSAVDEIEGHACFLLKVNAAGDKEWDKTLWDNSGAGIPGASVSQTGDGGYIVVGSYQSGPSMVASTAGMGSCLVKTDQEGNIQWLKALGAFGDDRRLCNVLPAPDGYVLVGSHRAGQGSQVFIKTDTQGSVLLEKSLPCTRVGFSAENPNMDLIPTADGGYLYTGYPGYQFFTTKYDDAGNVEWTSPQAGYNAVQLANGDFVLANPSKVVWLRSKTAAGPADLAVESLEALATPWAGKTYEIGVMVKNNGASYARPLRSTCTPGKPWQPPGKCPSWPLANQPRSSSVGLRRSPRRARSASESSWTGTTGWRKATKTTMSLSNRNR